MSYWVLHIADPHFSRSHFDDPDPLVIGRNHAAEIKSELQLQNLARERWHALVLSGDFTFANNPLGLTAATRFVADLADLVEPRAIVLLPGNHDVDLGYPLPLGNASLPTEKDAAEAKFRAFVKSVRQYVKAADIYLSMSLRLQNPGEDGLVLMGLNSCRVERWDAPGWGYVGLDQVRAVGTQLLEGSAPAKDGDVVLGILHHNLLPVWDLPLGEMLAVPGKRKLSFTLDAPSVLGAINDLGVCALLHGHTHVISPKHARGYGDEDDQSTMVLGSGSLGLFHVGCPSYHIQALEIDGQTIRMHDVTCERQARNRARGPWRHAEKRVDIHRWWDRQRAQRALHAMKHGADLARADWEVMDSWSRLRAHQDPARWRNVLKQILQDVRELQEGAPATGEQVLKVIQTLLFDAPPNQETVSGLTLQEYVVQHL
jgi:3',5'-cyclic AMP phosphodiesterase CpdA